VKPPDILNSKIKKIRIELPHYNFSHSSSGDSPHAFIGRERTREKLKQVIEDSPDEPGVYLIAGNRGVGKTSLVSEIIKETSLRHKSKFIENLRYVILLLLLVVGIQFCLQEYQDFCKKVFVIWPILLALTFITIGRLNIFRRKVPARKNRILRNIYNGFTSAFIDLSYLINPYVPYGKLQYVLKAILVVSFTQIISQITGIAAVVPFFLYLCVVSLCMYIRFVRDKWRKNKKRGFVKSLRIIFRDSFLTPIYNYIKNYNRLYLRINFGHKLNEEKDILRLITRTLSTEYNKFHRSFSRMLPWRLISLGFLIVLACSFSKLIGGKYCAFIGTISATDNMVVTDEKTITNSADKTIITVEKKKSSLGIKAIKFIRTICENINTPFQKINFLLILSFFIIYLFCLLLFWLAWKLHLFVTHGTIMRRLKKLNNNITHSTEHSSSVGVNAEKKGPIFGINTKKSREIADAREIEKELQDILNDMQLIPVIMCRPKVVIVFDELDKVEPSDTGSEKDVPQTKAALFSITATRERQTEILRILSNMKYFLSTAKAKFIFIAGREMYDIHLADVAERNNYIGSIFNVVILVPSFLTDHHTGMKLIPQESSIASLPEEYVCRRLIPYDFPVDSYNLKNYRKYLEEKIFRKGSKNNTQKEKSRQEKIQKVIAVVQQFIIYLAHVSKGAPKKMIQLFESFVDIHIESGENKKNTLFVQRYHNSRHFLSFNYYKQYTVGIVAYLITPVFYRLAESNIKELSDKLLVSALRFVDFLFKFHKNSFSWKHLDMSPEMLAVNRAPELKSVVVDLLNYFTQVHINTSNFSLSEYKFDSLIGNEIFAMAKTDEVFSALFSFSLDEMLPLKKQYQDMLEKTEKKYLDEKASVHSEYIDAVSSLQGVLGDLYYYDDELEEAEAYYKSAVQALDKKNMTLEHLYAYVRYMLRLGIIYEKRKQYDFAYLTYEEICKQIIQKRESIEYFYNIYQGHIEARTFDGLKMLYLPFIAKLQILELSHKGGITNDSLDQLKREFEIVTNNVNHDGARPLKAEFHSRVADILYYKNASLEIQDSGKKWKKSSCAACERYREAFSTLLNENDKNVIKLLGISVQKIKGNYDVKFCTTLARLLSDWGNVFFSCDSIGKKENESCILDGKISNTMANDNQVNFLNNCKKYLESEEEKEDSPFSGSNKLENKRDIAFAMYSISSAAYRKINLYKRSSFQIYKILCLFKDYEIYKNRKSFDFIRRLSVIAIHYLWYANDDLTLLELNKRKKDFDKFGKGGDEEKIPLQSLLVDTEITRIRILVKEMELKANLIPEKLKEFYSLRITSPYKINYSIVGRIYRLRLKTKLNYEAFKMIFGKQLAGKDFVLKNVDFVGIFENDDYKEIAKDIFGEEFSIVQVFENLVAESIYCLMDVAQLLETMEETYLFPHSFVGSIHEHLSFWVKQYEAYERDFCNKNKEVSHIEDYLEQYLDEEWREQLSSYRENQLALSHYYKCLEMHNEGRAYHNMIDLMCYVLDNYNDRSDHFNIAEERHLMVNGDIEKKIKNIKNNCKNSELYKVENYFEKI